ncbi:four helix bundle protein [Flavobacterium psychrotolerans]|uniref:Four helix bundle protein n=1 Tax=Flavobacterium psychrotolerans TaxID=2169410 RepID=A0A2U1JIL5_9FLAO|nr:four helix bundle protein [Flavobacterium psychrotolerans]PWA04855.1 four helix bundle protein [Flavobacterium psychrotolerans]
MGYYSFEDMTVWKLSMDIAEHIFHLTSRLPRSEDYGLTSQLRRAALSISANISEGFGRSSSLDKKRFYIMSRGSAFETKNHLLYGKRVHYFEATKVLELCTMIDSNVFELNKLIKSLECKVEG